MAINMMITISPPTQAEQLPARKRKRPLRERSPSPRQLLRSLAPVVGALVCLPALGAAEDLFSPYASYSWQYDDNLLRLYDEQAARMLIGTDQLADASRRAEIGINVNKNVGQQLLSARFSMSHVTFARFSELNHDDKDFSAQWNWHLGERFEGNLGASYAKSLTPFVDFHRREPNLRLQQRRFVDASWRFHPSWRLRGGFTRYELTHDLASQRVGDRNEDATQVGLDYLAPSQSSFGIQARRVHGGFPNQERIGTLLVDNSYDQNELMGKVDWAATGKTRVQFLGGHVQRKYDFMPGRDFSGLNARAIATWTPTGKTSVGVNAWRETSSYQDLTTSHTVNHGISVAPAWNVTAKARVNALIKREKRDFNGAASLVGATFANRVDTFHHASLAFTYLPVPQLKLQLSLYRDRQTSSVPYTGFRANGATVNVSYEF